MLPAAHPSSPSPAAATVARWPLRVVALLLAALVVFANRQPQWYFNDWIRGLAGNPGYRGPWLLVEHLLLSSSAMMVVTVPAWLLLAARGAVPSPRTLLGVPRGGRWVAWGIVGGLAPLAINVGIMLLVAGGIRGVALGFTPPSGWLVLGNVVSNFYEELVFRGFLVVLLQLAFGNRLLAWVLASAAHSFGHTQYHLAEQLIMGSIMVGWCWLVARTRSLWTTWLSHEVIDLIGDSLFKVG